MMARVHAVLSVVMVALAVLTCAPTPAHARDYSIGEVTILARVEQDGSLRISEDRIFSFDGSFQGVYWMIPTGTYEGRSVRAYVESVEVWCGDEHQLFKESATGEEGTFTITEREGCTEVRLFCSCSDEDAEILLSYTLAGIVSRWEDTAELYWQFLPDGWGETSRNVACTVFLPVPSGEEIVPGDNVYAWGHGPLDASIHVGGEGVTFTLPVVEASEHAEARIAFPEYWVPNARPMANMRLGAIVSEERRWADEANFQRFWERNRALALELVVMCSCVLTLLLTFCSWRRYRRLHTPAFDDKYFRDIPSDDHPAVLGMLYRRGQVDRGVFAASVMHLAEVGAVRLDEVDVNRRFGLKPRRKGRDYRLVETCDTMWSPGSAQDPASDDGVDCATFSFLFQTVADNHDLDDGLMGPNGERYVLMSYLEDVARAYPRTYYDGFRRWKGALTAACEKRGYYSGAHCWGAPAIVVSVCISPFLIVFAFLATNSAGDSPLAIVVLSFLSFATNFLAIAWCAVSRPMSQEGVELREKLGALRRWLKDFAQVDEMVPDDVALWNRLLEVATALGVADEVVRQLDVVLPQLSMDPRFRTRDWYGDDRDGWSCPARVMGDSFGSANALSNPRHSGSNDSSGSGSGGGFSSGGGGGFGSGGGGGAF